VKSRKSHTKRLGNSCFFVRNTSINRAEGNELKSREVLMLTQNWRLLHT